MNAVTKMVWDEQKQLLYTASKDKRIRVWKFPSEWHRYLPQDSPKLSAVVAKVEEEKKDHVADLDKEDKEDKEDNSEDELNEDEEEKDDLSGWAK